LYLQGTLDFALPNTSDMACRSGVSVTIMQKTGNPRVIAPLQRNQNPPFACASRTGPRIV